MTSFFDEVGFAKKGEKTPQKPPGIGVFCKKRLKKHGVFLQKILKAEYKYDSIKTTKTTLKKCQCQDRCKDICHLQTIPTRKK